MAGLIETVEEGGILVLVLAGPRRNRLTPALRQQLMQALERAAAAPGLRGVILAGMGPDFCEGQGPALRAGDETRPTIETLARAIAEHPRPVVAAVQGAVLDGGLELALAARLRVAAPDARLGLAVTTRDVLPQAGGLGRLARLAGAEHALRLALTGQPMSAQAAQAAGLVDRIAAPGGLPQAAVQAARELADLADAGALPPWGAVVRAGSGPGDTASGDAGSGGPGSADPGLTYPGLADPGAFERMVATARQGLGAGDAPDEAARAIIDVVEATLLLPPYAAARAERAAYEDSVDAPGSAGLCHLASAAEAAETLGRDLRPGAAARPGRIAVVGAGQAAADLVAVLLATGPEVLLVDPDADLLAAALTRIATRQELDVQARRLTPEARAAHWARLSTATRMTALADAGFAIETLPEGAPQKPAMLAAIDAALPPLACMATTLLRRPLAELAAATDRPDAVCGLHLHASGGRPRLAEIVLPPSGAPLAGRTLAAMLAGAGVVAVRAGSGDGLIAGRLLDGWRMAALSLLADGATPAGIDGVARASGHAFGPFREMDEAGLDRVLERLSRLLPGQRLPLMPHLVAAGWLGRRAGRGFYRHAEGQVVEDADVAVVMRETLQADGFSPRRLTAAQGARRLHLGLVRAGAALLSAGPARTGGEGAGGGEATPGGGTERGADRAGDIDLVAVQLTGATRRWGGPLHAADRAGLAAVLNDLHALEDSHGPAWTPPDLLIDLVKTGRHFSDLDEH